VSDEHPELTADLRVAIVRLVSRFRSERAEGELGDAAVAVLTGLQKNGPMTLTELSDRARVTAGSMSQTINRLVAGGYLTRTKDPGDGRRVLLEATDGGKRVGAAARAHRESWFNARIAELTDDERATLVHAAAILRRVAES
jgi:DNA-binding MarR family transcriptional regulator